MTDRELLEMAAKAAGYEVEWVRNSGCHYRCEAEESREQWRPLDDDGDALRLAAKLMLNVLASAACIVAEDENGVECFEYMYGPEDYTSGWRRAIVRAAAAIGSAK